MHEKSLPAKPSSPTGEMALSQHPGETIKKLKCAAPAKLASRIFRLKKKKTPLCRASFISAFFFFAFFFLLK